MTDVFISYSRRDIAFARILHKALIGKKLETWIDWEGIPPSANWLTEVYAAIESADTFVFIVSKASIGSEICQLEINHAKLNNKKIVPIVLSGVNHKDIPSDIAVFNWIFFSTREGKSFQKSFDTLLRAIETDLSWTKQHTRLQVRALEWNGNGKGGSFLLRESDLLTAENWLLEGEGKRPSPTLIQREFIEESRKAETSRKKTNLILLLSVLVVTILLATWAMYQQNIAVEETTARTTAQAIAETEFNIRSTAEIQVEQEQNRATARQLVSKGQVIFSENPRAPLIGSLLAIEALSRENSPEALQILQIGMNILPKQISQTSHKDEGIKDRGTSPADVWNVNSVAFSPDGQWVASSDFEFARVWEAATGKQIASMRSEGGLISSVAFSPSGLFLFSGVNVPVIAFDLNKGIELANSICSGSVNSSAFSPDGQLVATPCLRENIVRVWKIENGEGVLQLTIGARNEIAIFSPDGSYIATGGWDKMARVWNAQTGEEISRILHSENITAIAISPNSKSIASGSEDGVVYLWDLISGTEIFEISLSGSVSDISFSPDGHFVAIGSGAKTVLVDLTSGESVNTILHESAVDDVAFSPDNLLLASAAGDGTARIVSLFDLQESSRLIHDCSVGCDVNSIAFSPNSQWIATGGDDGTARVWETSSTDETVYMDQGDFVSSLSASESGEIILSGGWNNLVKAWDASNGNEKFVLLHEGVVNAVTISKDGKWILSGSHDQSCRIWNSSDGLEIFRATFDSAVRAVAFSADNSMFACGTDNMVTYLYDLVSKAPIFEFNNEHIVRSIAFSEDGTMLATASDDGTARVWSIQTGEEISRMREQRDVKVVVFVPGTNWIASGGEQGTVNIWNTESGSLISQINHKDGVYAIATSQNGSRIISGGLDGFARVWDPATGNELQHISHDERVTVVAFASDGQTVLSGSQDNTVVVWNSTTGEEIAKIDQGNDIVSALFLSANHSVVSASSNGQIIKWVWDPQEIVRQACARVTRNLTLKEWELYVGEEKYRATCPNLPPLID